MSTDATHPTARLIVTEPPTRAPRRVLTAGPAARLRPPPPPRWSDPSRREIFLERTAVAASAVALTAMVLACLGLVSLASGHPGSLVSNNLQQSNGTLVGWIAGPTGALSSWFHVSTHAERIYLTAAMAGMLACYLVVCFSAPRLRARWVVAAIVALDVIFFLGPPLVLSDIFNYLNYGRMEFVYHLNPYTTIPALEPRGDPTFLYSNWHGLLSPYGPLFTVFTVGLASLGVAGSLWTMKAALLLASLGTVFLTYRCALLLGRNPTVAVAIVGLNPIVLVWGLGGDHNDFLVLFFIVLAAWLLLRARALRVGKVARPAVPAHGAFALARRGWAWLDGMSRPLVQGEPWPWMEIGAGISLVAAVAIKASSAVLIPVILAGTERRMRFALGLVIGFAATVAMTLVAFGANLPNVGQQSRLVIPEGIPNLTGLALGFGGYTTEMRNVFTFLLIAIIAGCSLWAWRSRRWLTQSGWVTLALIVSLGWTLPWYIAWLLPFTALARSRALRVMAVLLGVYIYLAWIPYARDILTFLHVDPWSTVLGQRETQFMNTLLY